MLHEVLLALSGHPSPLFRSDDKPPTDDFPLLSPSEAALLQSIGKLAEVHRQLRGHVQWITRKHRSIICRAVATSVQQKHLARFQHKILEVERKILTRDASVVGAYDIVPLAGVVGEFDDWHRRMSWFWEVACLMQPHGESNAEPQPQAGCTGAFLIDELRAASNTGFPEIEEAATDLSKVAETAWLRQLSSWLLFSRLPVQSAHDFFIKSEPALEENAAMFHKDARLLPGFVTPFVASSILFIGKSLYQVKQLSNTARSTKLVLQHSNNSELAQTHLQHLSSLSLPIVPAQLSRAVSAIRLSLSQNVLQHLLPMEETTRLLSCLRQFMLLGKGEFALALISEAEARLQARQQNMGRLLQKDPLRAMQGLSIKEVELHQALAQVWKGLAREDEDGEDDILGFAGTHLKLSTRSSSNSSRPSTSDSGLSAVPQLAPVAFNDLLFPSATFLELVIQSPLDLFITPREANIYASVNAYLLAIRRAQVRLSDLWRRTAARRDFPSPTGSSGRGTSQETRLRTKRRSQATRKIWATCSAAIFLISEISAYFEGEIIKESCDHFEDWVKTPASAAEEDESRVSLRSETEEEVAQRDPETLAAGHRIFLAALTYALLLTDISYTRGLRSLLGNLDSLIAYFNRLLDLQQKLDLEYEAGDASTLTEEDEQKSSLELDRARKKVDSDLKAVVNRLRQLDHERIGSGRYLDIGAAEGRAYEPWKGGGVDSLLMKLEFGRMADEGYDIV
ncbi:hypothetical protein B0A50_00366 [Salinomyces thailandicus]|uniref:Spindle pole body component n=1 Tax=Salinomyces thailandicus TaxID=706561 RepID=A0A4U0UDF9_9PEZI|nr:hypothetical protein B0A50_00366 [Salinomyces thailandica]